MVQKGRFGVQMDAELKQNMVAWLFNHENWIKLPLNT
jgi:hypothetical protein